MNAKLEKTIRMPLYIVVGISVTILYVVYVPLAIIHALTNKQAFIDFGYNVESGVTKMIGWFRKGGKP